MMSEALEPNGNPVQVGNITLVTPGLAGVATAILPEEQAATRGGGPATGALRDALAAERVQTLETVEIAEASEIDTGGVVSRGAGDGGRTITLEVPDPGEAWGQAVLSTDESGVLTWSFAPPVIGAGAATRGVGTRVYQIRGAVPPVDGDAATRGVLGALGRKVIEVVVFPLLDPVLGAVGEHFARKWEEQKRPYRIRSFTPDDYRGADGETVSGDGWNRLGGGRALLMVHGTFSRARGAFSGMRREDVEALYRAYEGRVFAFDHFTISDDPVQNVRWFCEQLPDGTQLDLDIICHSRGGLVSRVLAEQQRALSLGSRSVQVGRIVFIATPNAGTVLCDDEHLSDLIDRYTNLLTFFPDNGATEVLEGVITVAKLLAQGVFKGLDGLRSMTPKGDFLQSLNAGEKGATTYHAVASNFEPVQPGLKAFLRDGIVDRLFGRENDLVVPTSGVYDTNGSGCFPIDEPHLVQATRGIHHSGYFGDAQVMERVLSWLGS